MTCFTLYCVMHLAAVGFDGGTTFYARHQGFREMDPLVQPLVGYKVSTPRMVTFGAAEIGGTNLLAKKYPKIGKLLRTGLTAVHVECGVHNVMALGRGW